MEDLRKNEDFEDKAKLMYEIFDDVITNLENVDKALQNIQFGAPDTQFSQKMVKVINYFLQHRAIKKVCLRRTTKLVCLINVRAQHNKYIDDNTFI